MPASALSHDAETLVLDHLGLANRCARSFGGRGVEDDDLEQVARLALVKAAHGYNARRGAFAPFATATMRGELKRHFRDRAWAVRPPRRIQDLQARIRAEHAGDITEANVRSIAHKIDADVASVREAAAAQGCFNPESVDAAREAFGHEPSVTDHGFDQVDAALTLSSLYQDLNDHDRRLLAWRFVEECSQQEIADRIGVSQMQVSRHLKKVLERLRASAEARAA